MILVEYYCINLLLVSVAKWSSHRLCMEKLVPLFLLSDEMGQFVREKLEYINIYMLFK